MSFRKQYYAILIRSMLVCLLAFAAGGCDSGPTRAGWSESALASMVKELQAKGIAASAGNYFLAGLDQKALCLNIQLGTKVQDRPLPRFYPGMLEQERNALIAERDAINKANRLARNEAVQRDFEIFAQMLRDKEIPLLRFVGVTAPGSHLARLQCKTLGLWVDGEISDTLRDIPALKRIFVDDGGKIDGSVVLPQVEEVVITGIQLPALFTLSSVASAFPNMRSLTLPAGSISPIDFKSVSFPASLTSLSLTSNGSQVRRAYMLNEAKKWPGIAYLNGKPAGKFDPIKDFSPEELAQYNAIPAHIRAEERFTAFTAKEHKNYTSVPLRGKILVHASRDFLSPEIPDSLDETLRNSLTENAEECDVLVVIETKMIQAPFVEWVGQSDPVLHPITTMYIFSKQGECESHSIYSNPSLTSVSEEQEQRNARYTASNIWGEIEYLFKKANATDPTGSQRIEKKQDLKKLTESRQASIKHIFQDNIEGDVF